MRVALTGATGFIGRHIARQLLEQGHALRCWHRISSDLKGFSEIAQLEWIEGELGDSNATKDLVQGCDAVVHAALFRPGAGFRGAEGDIVEFTEKNILGTLKLIQSAREANVDRFILISTCAVHEKILDDRPLDESHPLWPTSHYGAHKAALEKFVHSYGLGEGYPICALRPTGVYGVNHPTQNSKWYDLITKIVRGEDVECLRGGKEVHASDVAKAVSVLLTAEGIHGQAFNCYDRYISEYEVATLAKEHSGSLSEISGAPKHPKHQIVTDKIRSLGMRFGGVEHLKETVRQLIQAIQNRS